MADPVTISVTGAGRVAPLVGKRLQEFRRRNTVKNLFRELNKEIKQAKVLPRSKRKQVRRRVARLKDDGGFLSLLSAYLQDPRSEFLDAMQTELAGPLQFSDPELSDEAIVEIVVAVIERVTPRAQRDPRDATFANRQAVIAAVEATGEDVKEHLTRELATQQKATREAEQERSERLTEIELGKTSAGEARIRTSGLTGSLDPEQHLSSLEGVDPDSGKRLREIWEAGGVSGLLALTETPETWMSQGPATWVALGRLLGQAGEFEAAERSFLSASDLDESEAPLQLIRAAGWARIRGDEERYKELVLSAAALPGGDQHSSVLIAQARELLDSPEEMLEALAEVTPATSIERGSLESLRAQGLLLSGQSQQAEEAVARALAADPEQLVAKELKALLVLFGEQEKIRDGQRPNIDVLEKARREFLELRDSLFSLHRMREGSAMAARAIQACLMAENEQELQQVLRKFEEDGIPLDLASELARSALAAQRPDLVMRLLADQPRFSSDIRMLDAVARIHRSDFEDVNETVAELKSFLALSNTSVEDRGLAAHALLLAALENDDVGWQPKALEALREDQPIPAAILEAEYRLKEGDQAGAEDALLKYGADPIVLQRLAILAAENEDWSRALERSRALEVQEPSPGNLYNRAQILRGAGELKASQTKFLELAHNSQTGDELKGRAFGKAAEVASERDDYTAVLQIGQDWMEQMPDDINAPWFGVFALARLSRYQDALYLIEQRELEPRDLEQARLLSAIVHRAAPPAEALQTITSLSDRFDGKDEALEALVLFTALRAGPGETLPPELEKRVKEGFAQFPTRFPNSKKIWTIEAPRTAEEFHAFAKEFARDQRPVAEVAESIENGSGPIAALSAVTGRAAGETFLRLGVLPIGYGDPSLDGLEKSDAIEALGRGAVWDPSSLFVVGGLGKTLSEVIRNALPGSMIAQATLEDCDQSNAAPGVGGEEINEMGYDSTRSEGWVNTWDKDDAQREQARAKGMLRLGQALEVVPDADVESSGRWNQLIGPESNLPPALLTWPATFSVAERHHMAVFSDDRYVRLAARREGFRAFGTIALLEALRERQLITEERRDWARRRILQSRVWGAEPQSDELAAIAKENDWKPSLSTFRALSDRGFWLPEVMDGWRTVAAFLEDVWTATPSSLGIWVEHSLKAAARALPDNPSIHREALLIAALEVGVVEPSLDDRFVRGLAHALQVLPQTAAEANTDILLAALARVMSAIRGQPGWLAAFFRCVGRFPLEVQERVLKVFVKP